VKRPFPDVFLPAAPAIAVFLPSLFATGFIRDDFYIIAENSLLRSWSSLPTLLSSGYWEGALGAGAPVQEYRPALMLSFFLNRQLTGAAPWGFHLVNVLLHAAVSGFLFLLLRRRLSERAALAAACVFAVLPIHVEAVAYLSSRSELLVLLFSLLALLDFSGKESAWRRGLLWQALALLTKEQAVLLPVFLALSDHVDGLWKDARRRRLHGLLWALTGVYVGLRFAVLGRPFHGGADYFAGVGLLSKWLTVAKFWALHYVWPMVSGLGLNADFSRPLIADSTPVDAAAWLCLLAWLALGAVCLAWLKRGRPAVLLGAVFVLPLLPTSNLIIHLDTIGAERFLYTPSLAFCVLAGLFWEKLNAGARRPVAVCALMGWAALAVLRQGAWLSDRAYAEAAVASNPVSAGAHSALGVEKVKAGDAVSAEAEFKLAITLNANHPAPYYNLGKLYLERGRLKDAEAVLARLENGDPDADTLTLRAVVAESLGQKARAAGFYERALAVRPWDAVAHFNLGRLSLSAGRGPQASEHFGRYLELAPQASDAAQIRALIRTIDAQK
jgi:Flp pilus assembly protein TadD